MGMAEVAFLKDKMYQYRWSFQTIRTYDLNIETSSLQ